MSVELATSAITPHNLRLACEAQVCIVWQGAEVRRVLPTGAGPIRNRAGGI